MTSNFPCDSVDPWWIFLATSAGVFLAGLIPLVVIYLISKYTHSFSKLGRCSAAKAYTSLKGWCEGLISGSTFTGRVVVSLSCLFSVGSFVIYLVDATRYLLNIIRIGLCWYFVVPLEFNPLWTTVTTNIVTNIQLTDTHECASLLESVTLQIDLAFNIYFLIYFILRFIAANDKLHFWIELNSLVDIFTVPPVFVSIILNQQWLGFRFLRVIRLMNIPDLFQYLHILRTNTAIRLSQLISILLSVWLAAAGFVHLVENTGGISQDMERAQNITYWQSAYFIVITMSTVGYGDFYCKTIIGQAFIVIFVFSALAMFASFVPEIAEMFGKQSRYSGSYEKRSGFGHVVLCGHINFDTVDNFVRDFHHKDRGNNLIQSVFINKSMPDLEMEALLKRHFTNVTYIRGQVTNPNDLCRVKLKEAEACLIMADPQSSDPDSEDAANIMRLVSAKNFHPEIRVIIQLIKYQNKAFCMNLPFWTSSDQVICLSELKLGFMAAGTLAPGISTLIANLFVMRSYESSSKYLPWQNMYMRGAGMEIYSESFSSAFHGKTYATVFEICYTQLGVLLMAVAYKSPLGPGSIRSGKVLLNPDNDSIINHNMKGFFICQSEEEAKQVQFYCHQCHRKDKRKTKPCHCREKEDICWDTALVSLSDVVKEKEKSELEVSPSHEAKPRIKLDSESTDRSRSVKEPLRGLSPSGGELERYENTGMFYWNPPREFEKCILDDNNNIGNRLEDHVIVCCFASAATESINLRNLALPLRASNIPTEELRPIVFVGDEGFLRQQWHQLAIYPHIYVKLGSPLNRTILRSISIGRCHLCLVLSSNTQSSEDSTLCDKESILCSLNIKTMSSMLPQTARPSPLPSPTIQHKGALTLQVPQIEEKFRGGSSVGEPRNNIVMLTEITYDGNAQYLDQDDEDDPDTPLYLTQPFCCGRAFAASVLDTLMSSTMSGRLLPHTAVDDSADNIRLIPRIQKIYYNPEVLNLIRALVIGGDAMEMEQILVEGLELEECVLSLDELDQARNRSRIGLLHVRSRILRSYASQSYGEFVVKLQKDLGILVLGVYRVLCSEQYGVESQNRFVITNPPDDFDLEPNDKVFCLRPFKQSHSHNVRQPEIVIQTESPVQATIL